MLPTVMGRYVLRVHDVWQNRFDTQSRNLVHRHNFYEPSLVVSGTGEFEHGDKVYKLRPGDAFIPDPNVFHEIRSLETRDLEVFSTLFTIAEVPAIEGNTWEDQIIRAFLKRHTAWRRKQDRLLHTFAWAQRVAKTPSPHRTFFRQEAHRLLVLQFLESLTTEDSPATARSFNSQTTLSRALQAIDDRLHRPVMEAEIARAAGISERSLRRLFRAALHRTVTKEIHERKMQRAATLLSLPEFRIIDAARQVGIDDPAQFTKLFKKVFGITPRQARTGRTGANRGRVATWLYEGLTLQTEFRD
jgi:AraC-like DNA-binding protein